MPSYRAYILDRDNHIAGVHVLICDNDEAALAAARPFVDGCDVEVWDGDRKVGLLSHVK